jgi:succinate dehydrogenase / fumarate reductase cytochrome b subunit
METTQTNGTQTDHSAARAFLWGKLFSFAGLVPLGVYVVLHLYSNLRSLGGAEAFNQHLAETRSLPFIVPLAVLVIWIPITFHGLFGLFKITQSRPNLGQFQYFQNLKYVLQRLSGLGLLLFIPAHIYKTRIEPGFFGSTLDFAHMAEGLHEPLTLTVYALGTLGVAYHLANGFWQFCIGWGLTTSEAGMRRVEKLSMLLFVVLLFMAYGAIWGFIR